MGVNYATADKMIAERGPRYVVQVGVRRGELLIHYADTAERAESLYDKYVNEGGYQLAYTKVIPPQGSIDLAGLGRVRTEALRKAQEATDILRAGVLRATEAGRSEHEIARQAGVDRMTVRNWLGKR